MGEDSGSCDRLKPSLEFCAKIQIQEAAAGKEDI
jgi:hypothetical protein